MRRDFLQPLHSEVGGLLTRQLQQTLQQVKDKNSTLELEFVVTKNRILMQLETAASSELSYSHA